MFEKEFTLFGKCCYGGNSFVADEDIYMIYENKTCDEQDNENEWEEDVCRGKVMHIYVYWVLKILQYSQILV